MICVMVAAIGGRLFQYQGNAAYDILIARYELNRWPKNWNEVDHSTLQYRGKLANRQEFDSVQMEPLDQNRCKVTFFLHDSVGWRYSKVQTLKWSRQVWAMCRREDDRWKIGKHIIGDLETWLSKGDPLTAGHFPATEDVDVWNENPIHRDHAVTGVTITPISDSFSIQVEFQDGIRYDIPSEKVLQRLPPAIAWHHLWRAPPLGLR